MVEHDLLVAAVAANPAGWTLSAWAAFVVVSVPLVVIVAIPSAYFAPTIIAANRHHQVGPVAAINTLLGWTLIGWVGALVLALWTPNTGA